MVEGFDHRRLAPSAIQSGADRGQERERAIDAQMFVLQSLFTPLAKADVAGRVGRVADHSQDSHRDMMLVSNGKELLAPGLVQLRDVFELRRERSEITGRVLEIPGVTAKDQLWLH